MKIMVLGANGFVGSNVTAFLKNENHKVIPVTRNTLNLLDFYAVKRFLSKHTPDIVINCAAVMTNPTAVDDTINNLTIFTNFFNNSDLFGKFINLGSGAEYDRSESIFNAREIDIFTKLPQDSYGYGQNIKSRLCYQNNKFNGLKIFNCFGLGELESRIFPRLFTSSKFYLTDDRFFDFISIRDLCAIIKYEIDNGFNRKDMNCVYPETYKLSEIISKFINIHNIECEVVVLTQSDKHYTGDSSILNSFSKQLKLTGLLYGLENYKQRLV